MNFIIKHLRESISQYLILSGWMFVLCVGIRTLEAILLLLTTGQSAGQILLLNLEGIGFDVIVFCRFSLFFYPFIFLLYCLSTKAGRIVLKTIFTLFIAISTAMAIYFIMSGMPLDKIFFIYSWEEITHTVASSSNSSSWCYVFVLLFPILFLYLSFKKFSLHKIHYIIALVIFLTSLFFPWKVENLYRSKKEFYTAVNKMNYFYKSVMKGSSLKTLTPSQVEEMSQMLHQSFPQFSFSNDQYPFLHVENTEDVLSQYFDFTDKMPNFVFIIVEGLSREFSGNGTHYPSATPFLDSLSANSLSWNNCFSTSYRTIGVLPSLFASLPHGNGGFMTYKYDMPDCQSLMTILQRNGYQSTFYYGGWSCFDNMCYFLKRNKVNIAFDDSDYPDSDQNEWGLYDHILFQESLKKIDFSNPEPRIDIFLTLSTHQPFDFPDAAKQTQIYHQKADSLHFMEEEIPYLQLASFQYLDNALKKLITNYLQQENGENTIFIITGDHNFNMQANPVEITHVPLIIWSPLLKEKHQFPALACHRDVTPTLIAMMKQQFNIEAPTEVTWMSEGLDTVSTFRSRIFCPQIDQGRAHVGTYYNDYYLYQGKVYQIVNQDNTLQLKEIEDRNGLSAVIQNYLDLEIYAINHNILLEDKTSIFIGH